MKDKVVFWPRKKVKVGDLKDYEHNPRKTSKQEYERLVEDIKKHGFHTAIKVNQDNIIIGGHLRKKALLGAGLSENDTIEVFYSPKDLTEEEFQELNIKDNLLYSIWDKDILANHFDALQIVNWGLPIQELGLDDVKDSIKDLEPDPSKDKCSECGREL